MFSRISQVCSQTGKALVLAGLWFVSGTAVAAKEPARVLYINSYNQGYSWSDDIDKSFTERMEESGLDVEISRKYLDSQRYPSNELYPDIAASIERKFKRYAPDLVFVSDNDALEFALFHREDLFYDVPIVFVGYNNFSPALLEGHSGITGVNENVDVGETVSIALSLFPETTDIAVLVESKTLSGLAILEKVKEDLVPFYQENYRVHMFENASLEDVSGQLDKLPESSLFFAFGKTTDFGWSRELTPKESIGQLTRNSPIPIFCPWDFPLGDGIIGGMLLTGEEQGEHGAEMAIRILRGENANDIPVIMKTPLQPGFDYEVMQRFGIFESQLPSDSLVINKPVSFWREYWEVIAAAVGVFILQGGLIFYLIDNVRKRKHSMAELKEQRDNLEEKVQQRTWTLMETTKQLEVLSETDALTGLYNRRYLTKSVEIEIGRAKRQKQPLSLIIVDVDFFKKYNDTYGHIAGDECLRQVSSLIQEQCKRSADFAARYGGEEFVVFLPETTQEGAVLIAEKIQQALLQQEIPHSSSSVSHHITVSMGIVTFCAFAHSVSLESLFELADTQLYEAKRRGRNRYLMTESCADGETSCSKQSRATPSQPPPP